SSMRRPSGARTCSRIWPESIVGKKSVPTKPIRNMEPTTKNAVYNRDAGAVMQAPPERPRIFRAHPLELNVELVVQLPDQALCVGQPFLASGVNLHLRAQHEVHHGGH